MKQTAEKIVLDLCGGTGAWSAPYKAAGYTVHNITLPAFDVTKTYPFNGMASNSRVAAIGEGWPKLHFGGDESLNIDIARIHGILAAPPCTMFSLARTSAKTPRDFYTAMKAVRACLEIIWICKASPQGNLKWWALENPVGLTRQFLGLPAMTFEPWMFGDPSKKRTDLWGYFEKPRKLKGSLMRPDYPHNGPGSWANKSKRLRSITPAGFAQAFFKANP